MRTRIKSVKRRSRSQAVSVTAVQYFIPVFVSVFVCIQYSFLIRDNINCVYVLWFGSEVTHQLSSIDRSTQHR